MDSAALQTPAHATGTDLSTDADGTAPRAVRLIGAALIALVGLIMLVWSWGTWPDPVIDFGREIYVPWRLAQGDVLYRDIVSYFNGPLSPYTHALLFTIFGTSLRVLVIFNLLLIALLAVMLHALIRSVAGELTAITGGIAFFVLFAFAQFLPGGNYNYVCPYSYELPHGIILTVAGILFVRRWMVSRRGIWLAAAGGMLGLVFLTKAEVFLAAAAALAAGIAATLIRRSHPFRDAGIFLLASLVPPVIAWACLSITLSPGDALRGILGAWRFLTDRELLNLPYFRQLIGTNNIPRNLASMVIWTDGYAVLFGVPAVAGCFIKRPLVAAVTSVVVGGLVLGAGLSLTINWNDFIRPAPFLLLGLTLIFAVLVVRKGQTRWIVPLMLSVWALALLAKMPLNAHIYHYGFALAMPATLVLICLLMGWLPRLIERAGGSGWPLRATVASILLVVLVAHVRVMHMFFSNKTCVVARAGDQFYADARGLAINELVEHFARSTQPTDTLVMIPEGLIVNYLSRRINPTGQLNFTPAALIMYGEDAMLNAFKSRPPDWIVILRIDTSEYGPRLFGRDYAQRLFEWINVQYETVVAPELHPAIQLLRRKPQV